MCQLATIWSEEVNCMGTHTIIISHLHLSSIFSARYANSGIEDYIIVESPLGQFAPSFRTCYYYNFKTTWNNPHIDDFLQSPRELSIQLNSTGEFRPVLRQAPRRGLIDVVFGAVWDDCSYCETTPVVFTYTHHAISSNGYGY